MERADEGVIQLDTDYIDKLTTAFNRSAQKAANSLVLGRIGQQGIPAAELIIPGLVLLPGAPAQWGPARANLNRASFPQNSLPGIKQPQAQSKVLLGFFPLDGLGVPSPQLPINQQQLKGHVVQSVIQA